MATKKKTETTIVGGQQVTGEALTPPAKSPQPFLESEPKPLAKRSPASQKNIDNINNAILGTIVSMGKTLSNMEDARLQSEAAMQQAIFGVKAVNKALAQAAESRRIANEAAVKDAAATAEAAAKAEQDAIRLATERAQAEQTAAINRLADAQQAANAEAQKPVPSGTKTVRKPGGVVQTVQLMYDPVSRTTTEGAVIDTYKDFSAREAVLEQFKNVGLDEAFTNSLVGVIDTIYQNNVAPTEAQIENEIVNSEPFKKRFAANEVIRKRIAEGKARPGDRLLSPAEYIETEKGYAEIMQAAGLPSGFYDSKEDFTKFIENGISNAELTARVNLAQEAVNKADQNIVKALQTYYNLTPSDLRAYMLDPAKAFELIDSRFKYTTEQAKEIYGTAEVGGAALRAGLDSTQALSQEIYKAGKGEVAETAFQRAAADKAAYERLTGLAGEEGKVEDLVRKELALTGGATTQEKIKKLASEERARFQQRSAIEKTTLGKAQPTRNI